MLNSIFWDWNVINKHKTIDPWTIVESIMLYGEKCGCLQMWMSGCGCYQQNNR